MIGYQTDILKETLTKPTKLDVERIVYLRASYQSQNSRYSLNNEEAGELGEKIVLKYLKKYGMDDWVVIKNMWMNHGGQFEGDLILLTDHGPYLFEVKNYSTDYTYENGVSTWNDNRYSGNPINQTIRNKINLENIVKDIKFHGVLMLVGIDNHVEINSEISEIDTVQRTSLKKYIKKIAKREANHNEPPMEKKKILKNLERYEIHRLQGPNPLTDNEVKKLRKGIYCLNCKSYGVKIARKKVSCICGLTEEREMAILRTICEYGVLTFDRNLRIIKILDFFGGTVSRKAIQKVLREYFKEVKNGSHTYFYNLKLPYYKLYEILNINSFIRLNISHQQFEGNSRKIQYYNNEWEVN